MKPVSGLLAVPLVLLHAGLAAAQAPEVPPAAAYEAPVSAAPLEAPPPPAAVAPAEPVAVTALQEPDSFTTAGRDTGLPPDLWRGASLETVRTVMVLMAGKPLSPAASALARRVLATGAPGPEGAGEDPTLTAARAEALNSVGDVRAASAILARASGLDRSAELSRAAAESALLAGDDARACAIAENLGVGRDGIYWLRLRAYCLAVAGQTAQALLTFDLAQTQARDAVFGRLMGAKLAGAGNSGAASLRNGLDYALSRSLGLDLSGAKPGPAVAAVLSAPPPPPPAMPTEPGIAELAHALAANQPVPPGSVERLIQSASGDPKIRLRLQTAALLAAALEAPASAGLRGEVAALPLAAGRAPAGRTLALEWAAQRKQAGEAAMLALWISADAGPAGPALGDRVAIVRALQAVGLTAEAGAFALEGLSAAK